ncbi:hypothetical protein ACIF80_36115 [Streptomyces sp. NPDC085927]|uniref:hypothetical protein n=1 Tax=Streptomyces sp. NPDC085927 TaxID=3365738 RepID=UPI0037D33288
MPAGIEDVVGVLTEQIERRFDLSMDDLTAAVVATPGANPEATEVVKWHGLLAESQAALDRAEDSLLAALETRPSEVGDLADRVRTAVTARDGRAMVVRWLLDPNALGKKGVAAERLARFNRTNRQGSAVTTSPPARPATAFAAGRGAVR